MYISSPGGVELAHPSEHTKNEGGHFRLVKQGRPSGQYTPFELCNLFHRLPTVHTLSPASGDVCVWGGVGGLTGGILHKDVYIQKNDMLHKGVRQTRGCARLVVGTNHL